MSKQFRSFAQNIKSGGVPTFEEFKQESVAKKGNQKEGTSQKEQQAIKEAKNSLKEQAIESQRNYEKLQNKVKNQREKLVRQKKRQQDVEEKKLKELLAFKVDLTNHAQRERDYYSLMANQTAPKIIRTYQRLDKKFNEQGNGPEISPRHDRLSSSSLQTLANCDLTKINELRLLRQERINSVQACEEQDEFNQSFKSFGSDVIDGPTMLEQALDSKTSWKTRQSKHQRSPYRFKKGTTTIQEGQNGPKERTIRGYSIKEFVSAVRLAEKQRDERNQGSGIKQDEQRKFGYTESGNPIIDVPRFGMNSCPIGKEKQELDNGPCTLTKRGLEFRNDTKICQSFLKEQLKFKNEERELFKDFQMLLEYEELNARLAMDSEELDQALSSPRGSQKRRSKTIKNSASFSLSPLDNSEDKGPQNFNEAINRNDEAGSMISMRQKIEMNIQYNKIENIIKNLTKIGKNQEVLDGKQEIHSRRNHSMVKTLEQYRNFGKSEAPWPAKTTSRQTFRLVDEQNDNQFRVSTKYAYKSPLKATQMEALTGQALFNLNQSVSKMQHLGTRTPREKARASLNNTAGPTAETQQIFSSKNSSASIQYLDHPKQQIQHDAMALIQL